MLQQIDCNGIPVLIYENDNGMKVGMPVNSLKEHMNKHPEIADTLEGYLRKAFDILTSGKPYKNGKINNGLFVSGYNSEEIGAYIIFTLHQKFPS
jgi:hypothetical protein